MKPRIRIAEEDYEKREQVDSDNDSLQQKKPTVPIAKKIHKQEKDKTKKVSPMQSKNQNNHVKTSPEATKKRFKHLAVCIPDSLVRIPQSSVLRAYFVSQLARICTIFKVDEIIVLHDFAYKAKSQNFSPPQYMVRNLQYLETPQYLRKYLFQIHPDLANAGILNPIQADHHLKQDQVCQFREGVVIDRPTKANCGSWVDIGLRVHAKIDYVLPPKTRVTVRIKQPQKQQKFMDGEAVSKKDAETALGLYWGYSVRIAHNMKSVFKGQQQYTKKILLDSKIKDGNRFPKLQSSFEGLQLQDSVLLLFAGYDGLEAMIENDQGCKVSFKGVIEDMDLIYEFEKFGVKQLRIEQQLFLALNKVSVFCS